MNECLILLMGGNPLPNYIVAKYFLQLNPETSIFFICSKETRGYSNRIASCIDDEFRGFKKYYIQLESVQDSKYIIKDLESQLIENLDKFERINVNYTGGTKTMAVNVYSFLKEKLKYRAEFSYLSADDNYIRFEREPSNNKFLPKEVKVDLETLLKLHGYEFENNNEEVFIFEETLQVLKRIIEDEMIQEYMKWTEEFLCKYYKKEEYKPNRFEQFNSDFDEIQKEHFDNLEKYTWLRDLLVSIPDDNSLINKKSFELLNPLKENYTKKEIEKRYKRIVKFLNGVWLEEYVYSTVKNDDGILDLYKNREIKKSNSTIPFELDVLAINSYITILMSCTTDNRKHLCKLKGFEALHRVTEIGGDAGKAIIITFLDAEKAEKLQEDLNKTANLKENKLMVLGIEDLLEDTLKEKIEDFILN